MSPHLLTSVIFHSVVTDSFCIWPHSANIILWQQQLKHHKLPLILHLPSTALLVPATQRLVVLKVTLLRWSRWLPRFPVSVTAAVFCFESWSFPSPLGTSSTPCLARPSTNKHSFVNLTPVCFWVLPEVKLTGTG